MALYFRHFTACDFIYSRIGNDQRIRRDLPKLPEIFPHPVKIIIVRQYIGRDIYSDIPFMRIADSLLHILQGKIFRLGAQTERFAADVYRIGPVSHSCF